MTQAGRTALSVVLSLSSATAGLLLLLTAGGRITTQLTGFGGGAPLASMPLLLGGALLLAGAGMTLALSRLGVILTGAVLLLMGLFLMLTPLDPGNVSPLVRALFRLSIDPRGPANGFVVTGSMGSVAALGAIFLTMGLLTRPRGKASVAASLASGASSIATIGCVTTLLFAGATLYVERMLRMSSAVVPGVTVAVVILALAVTLIPNRWAPWGAVSSGALLVLANFAVLGATSVGRPQLWSIEWMARVVGPAAWWGIPLTLGAALIGTAVGSAIGSKPQPPPPPAAPFGAIRPA